MSNSLVEKWSFLFSNNGAFTNYIYKICLFWPLHFLHFLWYKKLQKVNFSCERSLWTAPNGDFLNIRGLMKSRLKIENWIEIEYLSVCPIYWWASHIEKQFIQCRGVINGKKARPYLSLTLMVMNSWKKTLIFT